MYNIKRIRQRNNLQIVLVCIYGFFIILCFIFIPILGWTTFWRKLKLPTMYPYFADLRTIQGAIIGASNGLNPQITNPNDPWGRPMNYPNIWVQIGHLLQIGTESHFFVFGIFIVFPFLACGIHLLWRFPSRIALVSLCSSSTLLAIERGNNDLLVFVLIYISVLAQNKNFKIMTFVLSVILKIYPIFAIIALEVRRRYLILVGSISIFYFFLIFKQFKAITNGNTAGGTLSYGFKTAVLFLMNILNHPLDLTYKRLLWVSTFLISVTLVVTLVSIRKVLLISPQVISNVQAQRTRLFLSGAGIYCGTFLFASNWDYRLIFLILCLPFLNEVPSAIFGKVLPVFFLIAMNVMLLTLLLPNLLAVLIINVTKVVIFFLLSFACFSILAYQILENQQVKIFVGRLPRYLKPLSGGRRSGVT